MQTRRLHITASLLLRNVAICNKSLVINNVIKQSMRDSELHSYNSPEREGSRKLQRSLLAPD